MLKAGRNRRHSVWVVAMKAFLCVQVQAPSVRCGQFRGLRISWVSPFNPRSAFYPIGIFKIEQRVRRAVFTEGLEP